MAAETLWIFGYGSLVWRPAFRHLRARPACIQGYARRFWQGSTDHRGVPARPGRVVTLVADDDAREDASVRSPCAKRADPDECWGTAYEVPAADPDGVLARLDHRERGGYERIEIELFLGEGRMPTPQGTDTEPALGPARETAARRRSVPGLVYVAGPHNEHYLGPASIEDIALQIAGAVGPSGPNREYVFELAKSLRALGTPDAHVFEVEAALRRVLSGSCA